MTVTSRLLYSDNESRIPVQINSNHRHIGIGSDSNNSRFNAWLQYSVFFLFFFFSSSTCSSSSSSSSYSSHTFAAPTRGRHNGFSLHFEETLKLLSACPPSPFYFASQLHLWHMSCNKVKTCNMGQVVHWFFFNTIVESSFLAQIR